MAEWHSSGISACITTQQATVQQGIHVHENNIFSQMLLPTYAIYEFANTDISWTSGV